MFSTQKYIETGKSPDDLIQHNLEQVPLSVTLYGKVYQLSGAILFEPTDGNGKYTAVVRFNRTWELYDDHRKTTYGIAGNIPVTLHTILYTLLN